MGIDSNGPEYPQAQNDDEVSQLLSSQLEAPVRRRTQNPLPPRRTESVGSITSLDSYAGGDMDKVLCFCLVKSDQQIFAETFVVLSRRVVKQCFLDVIFR